MLERKTGVPAPTSDGRVQLVGGRPPQLTMPGGGGAADRTNCDRCDAPFVGAIRANVRVLEPEAPPLEVALCEGCRTAWEPEAQSALAASLRSFLGL